jgi:hypothetical protein
VVHFEVTGDRPFTVAHEIGHILTNYGHHVDSLRKLMRAGGTSTVNGLGASKRLAEKEIDSILKDR